MAAAVAQVVVGLHPLREVRAALAAVREGRAKRLDGPFPTEIRPLVDDLNALLDHAAERIERARRQAGNLAHGLKTPLAILSNEAADLTAKGRAGTAYTIRRQTALMGRHIDTHLARARAAASAEIAGSRCPLGPCAERLRRAMERLHGERNLRILVEIPQDHRFRGECQDLEEMLGNLMDNACKWAKTRVEVRSRRDDDGPGLAPEKREAAFARGLRLDEVVPGTGLGLGIVCELAELYGGEARLEDSRMGGARRPAAAGGLTPPAKENKRRIGGADWMERIDHGYDVLIVGGGAAGLATALEAPPEARIAVLTKGKPGEGSTARAQGGIAAALGPGDSFDSHIEDTLHAGAGLCDPDTVRFVVERAPEVIGWLELLGIAFTRKEGPKKGNEGEYHLTREGGHGHRRIVHTTDATGRSVQSCLEAELARRGNVELFDNHTAVNLITRPDAANGEERCVGAYALDRRDRRVKLFRARAVVLATGGASRVYHVTSNPDSATGDGIAMAWRAGCRVANLEFTQFHPTCLYHPEAKAFLISEAVRGEGGKLVLPDGSRFMERFDSRAELAPRDIVARAIDHEMKRLGLACVYLDIRHQPADFIRRRFPTIHQRCLELGFDMTREPIPVVPAAHYTCGGIVTDRKGRTDLDGLYATGECAFTGLHGANRLASNSLLECLVFGREAGRALGESLAEIPESPPLPAWDESWVTNSDEEIVVSHNWHELRRFMWDYVGIVRTEKRLHRAHHRIDLLAAEVQEYYANFRVTNDLLELRDLTVVADLIIRSALARKESRGLHYTLDHPEPGTSAPPRNTVLVPPNFASTRAPESAQAAARRA